MPFEVLWLLITCKQLIANLYVFLGGHAELRLPALERVELVLNWLGQLDCLFCLHLGPKLLAGAFDQGDLTPGPLHFLLQKGFRTLPEVFCLVDGLTVAVGVGEGLVVGFGLTLLDELAPLLFRGGGNERSGRREPLGRAVDLGLGGLGPRPEIGGLGLVEGGDVRVAGEPVVVEARLDVEDEVLELVRLHEEILVPEAQLLAEQLLHLLLRLSGGLLRENGGPGLVVEGLEVVAGQHERLLGGQVPAGALRPHLLHALSAQPALLARLLLVEVVYAPHQLPSLVATRHLHAPEVLLLQLPGAVAYYFVLNHEAALLLLLQVLEHFFVLQLPRREN